MAVEKKAAVAAKPKAAEKEEPRTIDVRSCCVCGRSTALPACPRCGARS